MQDRISTVGIAQALLCFTIPLILSGLFQQLFNWVDAFIVGNVEGELALAGIGATTSIYNLFINVITGFTAGLSVLSAQQYGMGREGEIQKTLSAYTILLGAVFLLIAAGGILGSTQILTLLDTPQNIFASAHSYLQILLIGIPFLAVYNTYSAVLRGVGNSRAPFLSVLVSSVANVILDVLFVAVLGYGAAGAALATVMAQAAMTVYLIGYTVIKYPSLRFRLFHPAWDSRNAAQGARFGLPVATQSGVSSAGNIFLQRFMNGFGEQTVAAITTAYRVDTVIFLPIINFGSGIATIVAQDTGAGDRVRARQVLRIGTVIMTVISLALTGLVLLLGEYLIAIFGLTPDSVGIGRSFFHSIAWFYPIYGLSMAIRGYLEGTGDMVFSGAAGILSLLVRIVCSYAFRPVFQNMVVAYAEAFSWIFLILMYLGRYLWKSGKRGAKSQSSRWADRSSGGCAPGQDNQ